MKLPVIALLSTSLLLGAPPTEHEDPGVTISDYLKENKIDYIYIEPMKALHHITKMTIKASFSSTKVNATLDVYVQNDAYPGCKRVASFTLTNQVNTINYDYDQRYSSVNYEHNRFVFELESKLGSDAVTIDMKNYESKNLTVNAGGVGHRSPSNLILYRANTGLRYVYEDIKVTKCSDAIETTKSLTLPISNFNFTYKPLDWTIPFSYSNPRLVIETHDGYFPNLGDVREGLIRRLPLKINYFPLDGKVTFSIDSNLYVHPLTKDVSTTPMDGYIQTTKLYFPTAVKNNERYTMRYMIDEVGANGYNFVYQFDVFINKKTYGNCFDSYYCLSTEDSDPDTSLGVKISH